MSQQQMQYIQSEQGSSFNMTSHSAPRGLGSGPSSTFTMDALSRTVIAPYGIHALAGVGHAGHSPFDYDHQVLHQDSQRAETAALPIMAQFIRDSNEPWNSQKAVTSPVSGPKPRPHTGAVSYDFTGYREAPSEWDDSGYYGSLAAESVTRQSMADSSVCAETESGFDARSVVGVVGTFSELQLRSPRGRNHESIPTTFTHTQRDTWSQQRPANPEVPQLACPTCKQPVRTRAELNKHRLRHEKPFVCDIAGCTRKVGFGTMNDLDRHKQSVHGTNGIKYRCGEGQCRSKQKDWPRADNFKQHLKRVHNILLGNDADLSKYEHRPSRMEDLAGIGSSEPKLDGLPHPCWIGLDQSRSALSSVSSNETGFGQMEDHSMRLSQEDRHISDSQEMSSKPDHTSLMGAGEVHQARDSLEDESHLHLEMDDPILGGYSGPRSHIEGSKTASADDSYPGDQQCKIPPGLTPLPGREPLDTETALVCQTGSQQQPDMREHESQGSPHWRQPQVVSQEDKAGLDTVGQDSPGQYGPDDARDGNGMNDESFGEDAADSIRDSSENTPSLNDTPIRDLKDFEPSPESSSEPPPATLISTKNLLGEREIDESEASALIKSLLDKGMLERIISKLGYQKAKVEQEEGKPEESPLSSALGNGKDCRCSECDKVFKRPCELKKHMKRHQKPYACTHTDCRKRFGSKNDWKRHENSQHIQLQFWRCGKKAEGRSGQCGKIYLRRQELTDHLRQAHSITDSKIVEKHCVDFHNTRNFESRFWCGFCKQIVEFKQNGGLAWHERFDHIDAHFTGKEGRKMDIAEWKSIESEPLETFQRILPETRMSGSDGLSSRSASVGGDDPDSSGNLERKRCAVDIDDGNTETAPSSAKRRRRLEFMDPNKESVFWVCCDCQNYWRHAVTTRCMEADCTHNCCRHCQVVVLKSQDDR